MESDQLENLATADRILTLAREGLIDSKALIRSLELAGVIPRRKAWARFLDIGLLAIGFTFLIGGILFFIAYNWADMHRSLKFGLIGFILFGLVTFVSLRKLDGLPAKISLTGAAFVVGVLLAVISQGYQTGGADPYRLFFGWAGLITGWVIISSFTPLWVLFILIVNLGIVLYWDQALTGPDIFMFVLLFGINSISLLAWELGQRSGIDWLKSRWTPRLFASAASAVLVISTVQFIAELNYQRREANLIFAPLLFAGFMGLIMYYYSRRKLDLFILTVGGFSIIAVITSFLILYWDLTHGGGLLIIGLAIILQAGFAVNWLRRVEASWSDG